MLTLDFDSSLSHDSDDHTIPVTVVSSGAPAVKHPLTGIGLTLYPRSDGRHTIPKFTFRASSFPGPFLPGSFQVQFGDHFGACTVLLNISDLP